MVVMGSRCHCSGVHDRWSSASPCRYSDRVGGDPTMPSLHGLGGAREGSSTCVDALTHRGTRRESNGTARIGDRRAT
jgi:hypothetical protein